MHASKEMACLPLQSETNNFPFILPSKVVNGNQCASIFKEYLGIRYYKHANSEV